MMKQAEHTEHTEPVEEASSLFDMDTFEQVLLSYAEMCYSVAVALTGNPHRAQDLARHVLTQAWHLRDRADGGKDIKKKLQEALRKQFLRYYCPVPCHLRNEATNTIGEDTLCIAQNVKRNIENVSTDVRIAMCNS
jgi:hypothetical protein